MTESSDALLRRLVDAERKAPDPPAPLVERMWTTVERRLGDGPPPLEPGLGTTLPALKIVGGIVMAIVLVGGGVLWLGDRGDQQPRVAGGTPVDVGAPAVDPGSVPVDHALPVPADDLASAMTVTETARPFSGRAPTPPSPTPSAPQLGSPAPDPTPAPIVEPPASKPTRRAAASPRTTPKTLADEMLLMQRITAALKRQDPRSVLALVAEHERDFPRGEFLEERSAAKARGLCLEGTPAAGQRKAERFAKRWPGSIHLPAVRRDCGR